jgi:hypothetical protein
MLLYKHRVGKSALTWVANVSEHTHTATLSKAVMRRLERCYSGTYFCLDTLVRC